MEAIRFEQVIEKDGEIIMKGLPFKKGQHVELIFLTEPHDASRQNRIPSNFLRSSKLIGLWKDREDIVDSADYARQLRERAQSRREAA
jgi:hypothetical protein